MRQLIRTRAILVAVAVLAGVLAACGRPSPEAGPANSQDSTAGPSLDAGDVPADTRTAQTVPGRAGVRVVSDGPILTPLPPTTTTTAPPATAQNYVVQPGDTLSVIAERFNITTSQLAQANGITDVDTISPGDELIRREGPTMTDDQSPIYVVHEFRVSERNLLDDALDVFQPGWRDEPDTVESGSLSFVADSATFTLGLYHDEQPIGLCWGYRLRLPTGAKSMLIHDVQVRVESRKRGLGRKLVKAALGLARDEGHHHVWGVVEADNEGAHALALSAGAVSAGDTRGDVVYEWRFGVRGTGDPFWNGPPTAEVPVVS